jgi:membrane-bound serine protease (ClpP class)
MESMVNSIESFQSSGGSFITVVAPSGAFAFSAGAYVAEASNKIYMVPGTTIGSATPIVSGIPTGEENTTMRKDINAFQSYMETLAGSNGRNVNAAGRMVSGGVSYTCDSVTNCSAESSGVITGVLNATTATGALSLLHVPAGTPTDTPGIRSELISVLSDPNVSGLLFLVGVFAVLFDIYHPTIILSVVGVVVVVMALFGLGIFGANPLAIFLMIVGAAFIFLEVKTQHGISAVVGVVIFIVGFLLIFQFPPASASNPNLPAANFSPIPDITYGLLVALGAAIVIGSLYLRRIRQGLMAKPKVFDSSATIGKSGEMKTDIRAGGKGVARIGAEEWSVTSRQDLHRGDPVRVIAVEGLELVVEKATN